MPLSRVTEHCTSVSYVVPLLIPAKERQAETLAQWQATSQDKRPGSRRPETELHGKVRQSLNTLNGADLSVVVARSVQGSKHGIAALCFGGSTCPKHGRYKPFPLPVLKGVANRRKQRSIVCLSDKPDGVSVPKRYPIMSQWRSRLSLQQAVFVAGPRVFDLVCQPHERAVQAPT